MEITFNDNNCIIMPLSPKLGERETFRLCNEIKRNIKCKISLDLLNVKDFTIDFIDMIRKFKDISLFNIPSDLFTILIIMNLDSSLNLYTSALDYLENTRRLINRKFVLIDCNNCNI